MVYVEFFESKGGIQARRVGASDRAAAVVVSAAPEIPLLRTLGNFAVNNHPLQSTAYAAMWIPFFCRKILQNLADRFGNVQKSQYLQSVEIDGVILAAFYA